MVGQYTAKKELISAWYPDWGNRWNQKGTDIKVDNFQGAMKKNGKMLDNGCVGSDVIPSAPLHMSSNDLFILFLYFIYNAVGNCD